MSDVAEIREIVKEQKLKGKAVSFVPTMGALHAGHISLVDAAKTLKPDTYTVASIFVNPTQFGPGEDLDVYPRTLEQDLEMLESAGVDLVFLPTEETMYGDPNMEIVHVEPSGMDTTREGVARPQFYRGVATVVTKLFNIVQPDASFFGQKDAGQCVLIKSLVRDLCMNIKIVVVPTMREEADGLAMSSRNAYLNEEERAVAGIIYQSLSKGKEFYSSRPNRRVGDILAVVEESLRSEPLVRSIEYLSIASPHSMEELEDIEKIGENGAVLSTALKLGGVRLIDNVLLGGAESWTRVN